MAGPVLWGPSDASGNSTANNLETAIRMANNAGAAIISPASPVDPTSVATFGNPGDMYINITIPAWYQKQDSGTTTNWTLIGTAPTLNYFQGYTVATGGWSTSSTSFVDPTAGATPTLTTIYNNGISPVIGGSTDNGITFTPNSSSAIYLIIATTQIGNNSNNWVEAQLTDGTTVLSQASFEDLPGLVGNPTAFSAIYVPATTSPVTVKIQLRAQASTSYLGYTNTTNTGIVWTVIQLSAIGGGGGGSGVSSLNSITGAADIVAGSGITVTTSGQNITIAATGSSTSPVNAQYYLSTTTLIQDELIPFDTVITDTNSAFNTGTSVYTAPVTGEYQISICAQLSTGTGNVVIYVNGTGYAYLCTLSTAAFVSGSLGVPLNSGDTIGLYFDNLTNITGSAAPYATSFSIALIK